MYRGGGGGESTSRDARFQAKAWIQALAIYFQAICLSFSLQIEQFEIVFRPTHVFILATLYIHGNKFEEMGEYTVELAK